MSEPPIETHACPPDSDSRCATSGIRFGFSPRACSNALMACLSARSSGMEYPRVGVEEPLSEHTGHGSAQTKKDWVR
jgi:hypothetical protein